ncbi:MAG TPA: transporter substrate-binding domain-containing protein [Telmatospirillum sp.]|nr:transporter substrate-binding domain-containing protein [Telmatospirillum sp.]
MSKFRILPFALLLSAFSCVATAASAQSLKTVTFATDPEKADGFLLELTIEAFKKVGYETHVDYEAWGRALNMAYTGQVDGVLGAQYSDERAKFLAYSDLVAESPLVFFSLDRSNITYSSLKDISKYTIGTISGSVYPKDFAEASFLIKQPVSDYKVNLRKLLLGRIDLFVEKKFVVTSFLARSSPSETGHVVALDPPLRVNKFYNAFSKSVPDAAEKLRAFNKGLQMIKDEGLYATIMSKSLHE